MTEIATRPRTDALAEEINREHAAFESSYRTALGHAVRVGELLLEVKGALAHGAWLPWLAEHTRIAERNAQRYMQLARTDAQDPTRVADMGIKDALGEIATPRREPDPEPRAPIDLGAALREAGAREAGDEISNAAAARAAESFPRSGMERRTWREIGQLLEGAGRSMRSATQPGLGNYGRSESLLAAAQKTREASELLTELAGTLQ